MKGPRLFDHTDWKSKERSLSSQMFCFPLKVSVRQKKKILIVRDEAPHFLQALGFSLLSLYVNPALYLQSIFSLSTCAMSNLCGLWTHGSCFCSPHPTNKILKKTSLDLRSFLGFNFDGRPIKFQMYSHRGNIVEIHA